MTMARGRTGPNFSPEKRRAVLADYKAGVPLKKIMQKHKVSYQYASTTAKRHKLPMRSIRRRQDYKELKAEMIVDYKKGINCKVIARKFKVGNSFIFEALKSEGIVPNRIKRTRWEQVR